MQVSQMNDSYHSLLILVDLWTRLCFIKQGIIYHNVSGLSDRSLQWMVALTV